MIYLHGGGNLLYRSIMFFFSAKFYVESIKMHLHTFQFNSDLPWGIGGPVLLYFLP